MTNEQLKILLASHYHLLGKALNEAVELMPDDADREMQWWKGEDCTDFGIWASRDNHELRPTGRHLALIPIYDHLEKLEHQIQALDGKSDFVGFVRSEE